MQQPFEILQAIETTTESSHSTNLKKLHDKLLSLPPNTKECVSALHRLALFSLWQGNGEMALSALKALEKAPKEWEETHYANITKAIVLFAQNYTTEALQLLQQVLDHTKPPHAVHAMALDFLTLFLEQSNYNNQTHIEELRQMRINELHELALATKNPTDKAHFELRQACVLEEQHTKESNEQAIKLCKHLLRPQAKASTPDRLHATETLKRLKQAA